MPYVKKTNLPNILVAGGKKKQKNDHIENYVWRYHSTDIIVINPTDFTVTLNTNGWETVTTKERLNGALSALGINTYICQRDYVWYLVCGGKCVEYFDNVKISLIDGKIMNKLVK